MSNPNKSHEKKLKNGYSKPQEHTKHAKKPLEHSKDLEQGFDALFSQAKSLYDKDVPPFSSNFSLFLRSA